MTDREFQRVFNLTFAAACAVILIAVLGSVTVRAQALHGTVTNQGSGLCLQPENGSTVAGAAIVQQPCDANAGAAQLWTIVSAKSIYVHYVNQLSGMCLDARGGAQNMTPVQQWPCNNISNEYWVYNPAAFGKKSPVTITSGVSGTYGSKTQYCLDVPLNLTTAGVKLQIYRCNYTTAQQFF